MTKQQALQLIDRMPAGDAIDRLHQVWLRAIILSIPEGDWERYVRSAANIIAKEH